VVEKREKIRRRRDEKNNIRFIAPGFGCFVLGDVFGGEEKDVQRGQADFS
jgi:hypothetical protein